MYIRQAGLSLWLASFWIAEFIPMPSAAVFLPFLTLFPFFSGYF
jgi:hypothetical protein